MYLCQVWPQRPSLLLTLKLEAALGSMLCIVTIFADAGDMLGTVSSGDEVAADVIKGILEPAARRFQPDIILVSFHAASHMPRPILYHALFPAAHFTHRRSRTVLAVQRMRLPCPSWSHTGLFYESNCCQRTADGSEQLYAVQVSAGFDAHWRDPLEKLSYQSATYHRLVSGLSALADQLCGMALLPLPAVPVICLF